MPWSIFLQSPVMRHWRAGDGGRGCRTWELDAPQVVKGELSQAEPGGL